MPNLSRWQALTQTRGYGFACFLLRRFNEVQVPQVSASLTFTTLLALVPVLTVTLVVVSAFPMFDNLSDAFIRFINEIIMPQGAITVFQYINKFREKASNLTAIGIIMLGVTSLMLIRTIDQTFNHIWHVTTQRSVWMQFLVYWALLTFGPLAIAIGTSSWTVVLSYGHFNQFFPILSQAIKIFSSIVFNTLLLWLLYRLVPNRYVPAKHALLGAVATAVLLEIARRGFTWYIGTFNSYTLIYGAFAAIPFFLLWLNVMWMLVITGAVFTSALSYWQGNAFQRNFDASGRFDDILKILLLLADAQQSGKALKVSDFREHISMGYDELGDLLEKLARHGYIYQGKQGWVLKMNAEVVEVDELFKIFVYRPEYKNLDHVNYSVTQIMQPCLDAMDISLAEFSRHTERNKLHHSDDPKALPVQTTTLPSEKTIALNKDSSIL